MPYSTVAEAKKSIPSLKNESTPVVREFIKIFNALIKDGKDESKAIPIALAQARKVTMKKGSESSEAVSIMKTLLTKMLEAFNTEDLGEHKQYVESDTDIVKAVNDLERRALFVVLEPQDDEDETSDLQGDFYDEITVEKACQSFNKHSMKAGLYHEIIVENDLVEIEQSFISPAQFELDDGRTIKKGTWLMWMHFPEPLDTNSDLIWPQVLSGEFTGVSVECKGSGEMV